jgi:hypothetical protein
VAKRSPILGYNHNVRYRGLVFHVQTEDSGVMSPHLFTHLFHEGVIISTRKLVYDGSASEEAIKSLMQAQHKAVLKDLKIHTFDDKIDVYLANVEGLEPREGASQLRVSNPEITIAPVERAATEPGGPPLEQLDLMPPAVAQPRAKRTTTVPPPADQATAKPRTKTADRTSKGSQFRSMQPPEPAAGTSNPGLRPPAPPRTALPLSMDSSPEIEIIKHAQGESGRIRMPRDTAVDNRYDGIPSPVGQDLTIPSDGIPPRPADAHQSTRMPNPSRPPSHGAATLPAVRAPTRPAITPPSVVSRPLPPDAQRTRGDSEAAEIYAAAPPSADIPPGERSERPGQYSVNRRRDVVSQSAPLREHTGRFAVPSGLMPPRRSPTQQSGPIRTGTTTTQPLPGVPQQAPRGTPPTMPPSDGIPHAPDGGRGAQLTASSSGPHSSGNVLVTRPVVIVGAPARPGTMAAPKVRKAREDEGRGFGQGLISEKSLDEVILAYLSEDAEEK